MRNSSSIDNDKTNRKKLLALDFLIIAVLLVLDQFTKHLAVLRLKGQPAYVLIDGVLELQYLEIVALPLECFKIRSFLFFL